VHAEIARLTVEGMFTEEEIGTTCCFAIQDKGLVTGPTVRGGRCTPCWPTRKHSAPVRRTPRTLATKAAPAGELRATPKVLTQQAHVHEPDSPAGLASRCCREAIASRPAPASLDGHRDACPGWSLCPMCGVRLVRCLGLVVVTEFGPAEDWWAPVGACVQITARRLVIFGLVWGPVGRVQISVHRGQVP
jgi:hypothetical protein